MQRLSESVQRKFIDVIALDEWEIETPSGWQPVTKIMKTVKYRRWRLVLENGYTLDGADQHIVITQDGERFLEDLKPGDSVNTDSGPSRVVMCVDTGIDEHMYDVEVDDDAHLYYSNGIVSHNTTVAAGYILHQLIFNKSFSVAILANKGAQAREIMERVQMMYEELPFFLQPGVKTWNKGSISLGNKSKAFTSATSSSSIRGKSINLLYCLAGDQRVVIEDDNGSIYNMKIVDVPRAGTPEVDNFVYKPHDRAIHHVLYKITNTVNGKIYVGVHSTDDVDDGYMGSGKLIRLAIEKYGIDSFTKETLETFSSRRELLEAERALMSEKRKSYIADNPASTGAGKSPSAGKIWITDGVASKMVSPDVPLPENWYRGRTR